MTKFHEAHGLGGDSGVGVNLLHHFVDDGVTLLPRLPPFLDALHWHLLLGFLAALLGSCSFLLVKHGKSKLQSCNSVEWDVTVEKTADVAVVASPAAGGGDGLALGVVGVVPLDGTAAVETESRDAQVKVNKSKEGSKIWKSLVEQ
ncbi:hypothetical protein scyTo_0000561 [Scyliorhinus torazame]|uniref:Uncharacterized protein n=1 Tax=Scyliorhinus torazame TaxID=75743 RepID=A0A401NZB2_SCYTO|nr:hypothetical protein [Scyliorhinus torazame]